MRTIGLFVIQLSLLLSFTTSAAPRKPVAKPVLQGNIFAKKRIEKAIAQARACKVRNDCGGPIDRCPFGCGIFVNQDKILSIKQMLSTYPEKCEQKCPTLKNYDCINGKCESIFQ